jgi:hypothetical protein
MLKLSILIHKVRSSYSSCTGRSRENIGSNSGRQVLRKNRKDRMKLSFLPELVEKLVWRPSYFVL